MSVTSSSPRTRLSVVTLPKEDSKVVYDQRGYPRHMVECAHHKLLRPWFTVVMVLMRVFGESICFDKPVLRALYYWCVPTRLTLNAWDQLLFSFESSETVADVGLHPIPSHFFTVNCEDGSLSEEEGHLLPPMGICTDHDTVCTRQNVICQTRTPGDFTVTIHHERNRGGSKALLDNNNLQISTYRFRVSDASRVRLTVDQEMENLVHDKPLRPVMDFYETACSTQYIDCPYYYRGDIVEHSVEEAMESMLSRTRSFRISGHILEKIPRAYVI